MKLDKERGPIAATIEPPCNAVEATAGSAYTSDKAAGNGSPSASMKNPECVAADVAYRSREGRLWRHTGKPGQVLAMLATMPDGVTQWDTLPWHTRLGGTIHVLRQDGLAIETAREGDCRHARYRLATPGFLMSHDSDVPVRE